eukprot:CAMPEP_0197440730 /NCGR_PEP_ID=MMETSP1175-20131217/7156_1 /TAXON_ID=1003142 /ORGANISM="Triceratium dubium, Strain CCMP147" /LENGTH=438 /DNA_ID=CAMNT_0042970887 /DNA_START=363 /DNA_END=1679 /DNA_ORIENTATION=+
MSFSESTSETTREKSQSPSPSPPEKKKKSPLLHLVSGGAAGLVESSVCHPLDTIKTRMQLRRQSQTIEAVRARSSLHEPGLIRSSLSSLAEPALRRTAASPLASGAVAAATSGPSLSVQASGAGGGVHEPALRLGTQSSPKTMHAAEASALRARAVSSGATVATLGPVGTARRIIQREGFLALYKGLTAVYTGIIPKMAIRFLSFEQYREVLQGIAGGSPFNVSQPGPGMYAPSVTFLAGLASGLTEAVLVVTPAEVCKIRMQSQHNSLIDPSQLRHRKYTNVIQTAFTIVREEGPSALYKGVVPTMMRQGCNQAVNFTTYNAFKRRVVDWRRERGEPAELRHWQSLILGGVSGGFGPMVNNPLDVVKTRMQKQVILPGKEPKYTGLLQSCGIIAREEGYGALWKGITPRLLRIMPGQAITFMTYEAVSSRMVRWGWF